MKKFELQTPDEVRYLVDGRWQNAPADVKLTWKNNTAFLTAPRSRIEAVGLCWKTDFEGDPRFFGDAWERSYGTLGWSGCIPERLYPWYLAAKDEAGCSLIGVETGCSVFATFMTDTDRVVALLDTRSGSEGVLLGERTLEMCTFHAAFNVPQDAYSMLCGQLKQLCRNPRMPRTPVYGGNNWYYAYGRSSRKQILADTDFIAEMSDGLENRPFMVIDDGWQVNADIHVTNGGPWTGIERFGDMGEVADLIRAKNVRPGLWYRPLLMNGDIDESWIRNRTEEGLFLDPSVPAVLDFVRETTAQLAGWGYELLKHDFTTFDIMGDWGFRRSGDRLGRPLPLKDTSRTNAEWILALYNAIREGAGDRTLIIGCNTVSHLSAGIFDIQRTGDDTSGIDWERTRFMGVNTLAMRMPQHGAFYAVDADCVGSTPVVPWEKNAQWLHLLSVSGTPLFVSADGAVQTEKQKQAIAEAFRIASLPHEPAQPLDWERTTTPREWKTFEGLHTYDWFDWYTPDTTNVYWR